MKRVVGLIGAIAASLTVARPSAAQPVFTEPAVSFGYQMLHIPDETYPLGFNIDASGRMSNGWTLVGELGWAKDEQTEPGVSGTLKFMHYGAGPRWNFTGTTVRPFAQLIAGGVHTDADTNLSDDSDNAFMLQPGVGVVVPIAPRWGAIGQFDYRRVFFREKGDNEWRFVIGVRFGLR